LFNLINHLMLTTTPNAEKLLLAAQGYFELGMMEESLEEVAALPEALRKRFDVLQLQLLACMRVHRWEAALAVSRQICHQQPEESLGFIHAAFCLHELGRTAEAKRALLSGPAALLREATYHYNLGCYDAVLGNLDEAQAHLRVSFKLDRHFREFARTDPDLKEVWALL
jgi:tetratricopeptide (TPR) repeat protein